MLIPALANSQSNLKIDNILLKCKYIFIAQKDVKNRFSRETQYMQLLVNNNKSIYYSQNKQDGYEALKKDIISGATNSINIANKSASYGSGLESEIVVNNMKGFNIFDKLEPDFTYNAIDSFGIPKWKILNDTTRVMGLLCIKATTTFRGRNYTAWYNEAIPLKNGPWKLCGLPGLIMKAFDDQHYFEFECQEITNNPKEKFVLEDYNNLKQITLFNLQSLKKLRAERFLVYINQQNPQLTSSASTESLMKKNPEPYNPLELSK